MSEDRAKWTEADFGSLSWHDNHIHGWQIKTAVEEDGTGELVLDIDYIVEWLCPTPQSCVFRIAPATLTFHEVFGLRVEIDYASAGVTPPSISEIEREAVHYPNGYTSYKWIIGINWPKGQISFEGTRFTQVLRAQPVLREDQCLSPEDRGESTAAEQCNEPDEPRGSRS